MFGFSALFGRSREVQRLDAALRIAGLHPALVPDAVKIAALKLLKETGHEGRLATPSNDAAAEMLAYCMLGDEVFLDANGLEVTQALQWRLEAALESGDSLDAQLVLLTLHAGLIQHALRSRYGLHATDTP